MNKAYNNLTIIHNNAKRLGMAIRYLFVIVLAMNFVIKTRSRSTKLDRPYSMPKDISELNKEYKKYVYNK